MVPDGIILLGVAIVAAPFVFRAFLMLCIWWTHKYGP